MNYHLLNDDKFIDDFIDVVEGIQTNNNKYLIFRNKNSVKYVSHPKITYVKSEQNYLNELIRNFCKDDKVFIHYLRRGLYEFIISIPIETRIGLFFWGGDIVEYPTHFYKKFNYEPQTLKYYNKHKNPYYRIIRFYRNPKNILRYVLKRRQFLKQEKSQLELKNLALSRIDYLLNWNPLDYEQLLKKVKRFKARDIYHFYGIGLESDLPAIKNNNSKTLKIWLGNSAALANNHMDALKVLGRLKDEDIEILCPLSYGDYSKNKHYTSTVIKYGKDLFGEKFIPLTAFLQRSEYYRLLQETDIIIMFQNRTQANGNISASLSMGKKIFLHKINTIYQLYKKNDIKVFSVDEFNKSTFDQLKCPLTQEEISMNIKMLKERILNTYRKESSLAEVLKCVAK